MRGGSQVQEASQVHIKRRNRPEAHHLKRHPRLLRAGGAGWKDMCGHHQPACEKDDGHSLRGHADLRCVRVRRTGRTEPADAGRCDPGRSKAVLR